MYTNANPNMHVKILTQYKYSLTYHSVDPCFSFHFVIQWCQSYALVKTHKTEGIQKLTNFSLKRRNHRKGMKFKIQTS
jgi:hypothetical protein